MNPIDGGASSMADVEGSRLPLKWDGPTRLNPDARCNTYCYHRLLDVVGNELATCNILDRFRASCFGHLLRYDSNFVVSGKLLITLMAMEVAVPDGNPFERHFLVGNHKLIFSKLEFCMFSGLKFGASTFDPEGNYQIFENGIYNRRWPNQSVVASDLAKDFANGAFRDDPEDALKVAFVIIATLYLFGPDDRCPVYSWMWHLVEDEYAFNAFPWGSYVFQRAMIYLDRGLQPSPDGKKLYHIYGYIVPLQLWALEVFPELGAALGDRSNDDLPRGVRWKCIGKCLNIHIILHRRDIRISDVRPTPVERLMPYIVDIDMDLWTGIRYVHHDRPIEKGGLIGVGRRLKRSDTIRMREINPTLRGQRKRARPQTSEAPPPAPAPALLIPPPLPPRSILSSSPHPPPLVLEMASGSSLKDDMLDMLRHVVKETLPDMLRQIVRESLPNVMRQVVRECLPDVVREVMRKNVNPSRPEAPEEITFDANSVCES